MAEELAIEGVEDQEAKERIRDLINRSFDILEHGSCGGA
jgi:hypothetical protein